MTESAERCRNASLEKLILYLEIKISLEINLQAAMKRPNSQEAKQIWWSSTILQVL